MATAPKIVQPIEATTQKYVSEVGKARDAASQFRKESVRLEKRNQMASASFQKAANAASVLHGPLNGISGRLSSLSTSFRIMSPLAIAAGASITALTAVSVRSTKQLALVEHQMLRLNAVFKATGYSAGQTAESFDQFARSLARSTLASSEGVREAGAILATFADITGSNFDETIVLAQDMAEVFGGNLTSSVQQLAKALQDPILGLSALRRSGISFTEAQREQIKVLHESGQALEAQNAILAAVKAQVGGAAAAVAEGSVVGQVDTLTQNVTELGEQFAKLLKLDSGLKKFLANLNKGFAEHNRLVDAANSPFLLQRRVDRTEADISQLGFSFADRRERTKLSNQLRDLEKRAHEAWEKWATTVSEAEKAANKAILKNAEREADRVRAERAKLFEKESDALVKLQRKSYEDASKAAAGDSAVGKELARFELENVNTEFELQDIRKQFGEKSSLEEEYQSRALDRLKIHQDNMQRARAQDAKQSLGSGQQWAQEQAKILADMEAQRRDAIARVGAASPSAEIREEARHGKATADLEAERAALHDAGQMTVQIEAEYQLIRESQEREHVQRLKDARTADDAAALKAIKAQADAEKKIKDDAVKNELRAMNAKAKLQMAGVELAGASFGALSALLEQGTKEQQAALVIEKGLMMAKAVMNMNLAIANANAQSDLYSKAGHIAAAVGYGSQAVAGIAAVSIGSRAGGGPVFPNAEYWVGERGREKVRFGMPGTITPAHKSESTKPVVVNLIEDASRAGQVEQSDDGQTIQVAVAVIESRMRDDLRRGRGVWGEAQQQYGLQRRGSRR